MPKEMALMDAFEKTLCHDDLCQKKPQSKVSKQENRPSFGCCYEGDPLNHYLWAQALIEAYLGDKKVRFVKI